MHTNTTVHRKVEKMQIKRNIVNIIGNLRKIRKYNYTDVYILVQRIM